MDARVVWHVWRRILREEPVRAATFGGRLDEMAGALRLSPAEVEVAREYGTAPAGAQMFVDSYRFRMVRSFFNALETAAPLTHRALAANNVDLRTLAVGFLDRHDWLDFGPFVFTFGRQILDHLTTDDSLTSIVGLTQLMRLERTAIDVITAAAENPTDPDSADPGAADGSAHRWRARPWFAVCKCDRDLSEWLRNPVALGRAVPPPAARQYVVFLPALDADRRIVALPPRAVDLLRTLRQQPMTAPELADALRRPGHAADPARDRQLLERLTAMRLVDAPADGR